MNRIPPHILYPGIVVAILSYSIISSYFLVRASQSDGGAQVLENYYERSVHWDDHQAVVSYSDALNWQLRWELLEGPEGFVTIVDAYNTPVVGVGGKLRLRRPQLAEDVSVREIEAVASRPGVYRFDQVELSDGYWDVVLEGEYNQRPILFTERQQIRQ